MLQKTILDEEKKKDEVRRKEDEKVRVEEVNARAIANENIERAAAISEEKVRMRISEHDTVLEALFEKQRLKEDKISLAASRASSPPPASATALALPECPVRQEQRLNCFLCLLRETYISICVFDSPHNSTFELDLSYCHFPGLL